MYYIMNHLKILNRKPPPKSPKMSPAELLDRALTQWLKTTILPTRKNHFRVLLGPNLSGSVVNMLGSEKKQGIRNIIGKEILTRWKFKTVGKEH